MGERRRASSVTSLGAANLDGLLPGPPTRSRTFEEDLGIQRCQTISFRSAVLITSSTTSATPSRRRTFTTRPSASGRSGNWAWRPACATGPAIAWAMLRALTDTNLEHQRPVLAGHEQAVVLGVVGDAVEDNDLPLRCVFRASAPRVQEVASCHTALPGLGTNLNFNAG